MVTYTLKHITYSDQTEIELTAVLTDPSDQELKTAFETVGIEAVETDKEIPF